MFCCDSFKITLTLTVWLIAFLNFVSLKVTNAKKISFLEGYRYIQENWQIFEEEYNDFRENIFVENEKLLFKYVKVKGFNKDKGLNKPFLVSESNGNGERSQSESKEETPSESQITISPNEQFKLFSIPNDFVISKESPAITENEYYSYFFNKIIDEENMLAIFILSEINQDEGSKFYEFLHNLPVIKTPLLYEHSSLDLFREDDSYQKLFDKLNYYKKSYNEMRRLVFSFGEELKDDFIGAFLYGDYLWALNIVNNYSLKIDNKLYLIHGTEYFKLFGLETIDDHKIRKFNHFNCCLKYSIKKDKEYTHIYTSYTPEDLYDFYDKFQDINNFIINPDLNSEDLYFNYGIVPNNFDLNLDYYNIKAKDIFKEKKSLPDKTIRISLNEYDLKNFIYYMKTVSTNFTESISSVISYIEEKVFTIDRVFEQSFQNDNMGEVLNSFKFLSHKKQFYQKIKKALKENKIVIDTLGEEKQRTQNINKSKNITNRTKTSINLTNQSSESNNMHYQKIDL